MTPRLTRAYHRQVARLEAAEDLRSLAISLAPHMKEGARRNLADTLRKRASGESDAPKLITSPEELSRFLRGER